MNVNMDVAALGAGMALAAVKGRRQELPDRDVPVSEGALRLVASR